MCFITLGERTVAGEARRSERSERPQRPLGRFLKKLPSVGVGTKPVSGWS